MLCAPFFGGRWMAMCSPKDQRHTVLQVRLANLYGHGRRIREIVGSDLYLVIDHYYRLFGGGKRVRGLDDSDGSIVSEGGSDDHGPAGAPAKPNIAHCVCFCWGSNLQF